MYSVTQENTAHVQVKLEEFKRKADGLMSIEYEIGCQAPTSHAKRTCIQHIHTKKLYKGDESYTHFLYFTDEHINPSWGQLPGKGTLNNRLSAKLMEGLNKIGVETYFLSKLNMREQLVREIDTLPFLMDVNLVACDDLQEKFNCTPYMVFPHPLIDYRFKNTLKKNPIATIQQLTALGHADDDDLDIIQSITHRTADFLRGYFYAFDLVLLKFKMECGRLYLSDHPMDCKLVVADEISLDTCCFLDLKTGNRIDIHEPGFDVGFHQKNLNERYTNLANRLGLISVNPNNVTTSNTPSISSGAQIFKPQFPNTTNTTSQSTGDF